MDDKQLKKVLRKKAQQSPDKYYPTATFKQLGLSRYKCSNCGNFFWSSVERTVCGEPECCGGYSFIGNTPAKEKMDFIQVWDRFQKMFKKQGYTPIKRYPSVARWNPTMDFTIASIAGFQPYVVSGEIKPPANPLVIPQFCMRFSDIENVGITGRHYTGFSMIGQHAFVPSKEYNQNKYFNDIFNWLTKGMKLPKDELVFHEDAWGGGGNFGPSIEFFSRGLELGNQVYMQYERDVAGNLKDLDINVLDMGMGQERPAWFTHGTETSYEANFGPVVSHLYKKSGVHPNRDILKKFLPYSGYLNLDEVDDINKTWNQIAQKTGYDVKQLKDNIIPLSGIYSICDHTRSLLVALTDGALPSNVGGGYNLRALYRRSLDFINRYGWDIDLNDVCRRHAKYLKPQYPELSDNLGEVSEILESEMKKYKATKNKSKKIVEKYIKNKKTLTEEELIKLYDSKGISPEMLNSLGFKIKIPDNFYARVTEMHEIGRDIYAKGKKNITLNKLEQFDVKMNPALKNLPNTIDALKALQIRVKMNPALKNLQDTNESLKALQIGVKNNQLLKNLQDTNESLKALQIGVTNNLALKNLQGTNEVLKALQIGIKNNLALKALQIGVTNNLALKNLQGTNEALKSIQIGVKMEPVLKNIQAINEKLKSITQITKIRGLEINEAFRNISGVPTKVLYFDDYLKIEFKAKVVKIIGNDVILDKTYFYPTSGGQAHDTGTLNGIKVVDIFKQGAIIIHTLESRPSFIEGDTVSGHIDKARRIQLSQHHTATHIINGASRKVLGEHIWQAGAEKTEKKARLDITHYDLLTPEQIKAIEKRANDIIKDNVKVSSMQLPKDEAEKLYGTRLYQGGAVPGAVLRVIEIKDFDVEACGGTHVKNTGEVGCIKIIGTRKIQDGVIRLEFVAGKKTDEKTDDIKAMIVDISKVLGVTKKEEIVPNCEKLFKAWKSLRKIAGIAGYAKRIKETDPAKFKGMSENVKSMYAKYQSSPVVAKAEKVVDDEGLVAQLMQLFNVQRENLVKTLTRFKSETESFTKLIDDVV